MCQIGRDAAVFKLRRLSEESGRLVQQLLEGKLKRVWTRREQSRPLLALLGKEEWKGQGWLFMYRQDSACFENQFSAFRAHCWLSSHLEAANPKCLKRRSRWNYLKETKEINGSHWNWNFQRSSSNENGIKYRNLQLILLLNILRIMSVLRTVKQTYSHRGTEDCFWSKKLKSGKLVSTWYKCWWKWKVCWQVCKFYRMCSI